MSKNLIVFILLVINTILAFLCIAVRTESIGASNASFVSSDTDLSGWTFSEDYSSPETFWINSGEFVFPASSALLDSMILKSDELRLSNRQKTEISKCIKELSEKEKLIEETNRNIIQVHHLLTDLGYEMCLLLTQKQLEYISAHRDSISLDRFEKPYWDSLKERFDDK